MNQIDAQQVVDLTDFGQELDSLRRRTAELEREVERCQRLATLGTLAASIAHEFNNLLTPILSYAQLALQAPEDGEMVNKALRKAIEGSEKASAIASSMLGFIRDEDDGCVHVAHAVSDALGCLARDLSKDGIRLSVEVGPECWARMRPVALEQVLLNLILNARDAMKPGGGSLTIHATCSTWNIASSGNHPPHLSPGRPRVAVGDGSDEIVEISVQDTGCGMAPELSARVFEPFVRDRTRGRSSTGLGLSICKRLVEEVGGGIGLESAVGSGTRFLIRVPRADPAVEGGVEAGGESEAA